MTIPTAPAMAIDPFFIGPPSRQLFACYHTPAEPARDCGVVICHPMGQEYIRSHRGCLRLAEQLAQAGFPSLRFDYSGTGDSAGDADDVDLDQWQADIRTAIGELRERSGVGTFCLIGLRLGASLAAMVATDQHDVTSLVLWDPVVNGGSYIEQTAAEHQAAIWRFFAQPKEGAVGSRPTELLGFPISPRMLDQISAIDLLQTRRRPARSVLIAESHTGEPAQLLRDHLQSLAADVDYQHIPCFRIWTETVDKGLVPSQVIAAIVDKLSEAHQ